MWVWGEGEPTSAGNTRLLICKLFANKQQEKNECITHVSQEAVCEWGGTEGGSIFYHIYLGPGIYLHKLINGCLCTEIADIPLIF